MAWIPSFLLLQQVLRNGVRQAQKRDEEQPKNKTQSNTQTFAIEKDNDGYNYDTEDYE